MNAYFKSIAGFALIVFMICGGLAACGAASDFPHEKSDLSADTAVTYGKLANGVRYAVMQNDTPTQTAALRVRFDTGSLNESDDQRGMAHFLEHMAFNGSKNIPEGEMIKRLERFGLAFGADTNAYTSFDETVYMLDLPEVGEEILDETLFIMRETAEYLSLDQDAIDRERGVVQSEKRRGDSAAGRASRAKLAFLTRGSRISDRLPIGTDETLAEMGAESFRRYYDAYYRPESTFVVLVGDLAPELAIAKIETAFGDWQAKGKAGPQDSAGETPIRTGETGYFSDPEIQSQIILARILPYKDEKDTRDNRQKAYIKGLGNRILNRRLSSLARKEDAVFIAGGAGHAFALETADIMTLTMASRPENWDAALAVGEQELRKALEFGFTQAELDEQLANSRKSREVAVQTSETRRTAALASGILNSFAGESVFTHPVESLEHFDSFVDEITLGGVWDAFKIQWLGKDGKGLEDPLLYLQTSLDLESPEETIKAAFVQSRAVDVRADDAQDIGEFAYTEFGAPGKIASQTYIEDVDATSVKFENNVMLNFKRTDFAKDRINISVSIGGGALSIPRKDAALRILAGNVMSAGGLAAHSADDIERLLAGKAVGAGFGISTNSFIISGATVPSDFADQMNVMTAQLIAPGYRSEAKARFDKYIESWYPTLDSTPQGVSSRDVNRLIYSGDPRYGIPSQDILLGAKVEDVKAWLTPHLESAPIEIGIVGDISLETAIEQVARTFGALPARASQQDTYPDMTKVTFPKGRKAPITLTHSGDANRALLQVFWPAPDGQDVMVNRRLNILRSIFSNRLIDVIREEESAAYSPSAGWSGSRYFPGYGYMTVSLGITPEKVPDMITKLDEIAADFGAGNISDDEFERAIQPVLENLDSSLENNGYWMNVIARAQTETWGIDNFRTREETFQNMTLAELKPLASQIFRAKNAYRVQILPQP